MGSLNRPRGSFLSRTSTTTLRCQGTDSANAKSLKRSNIQECKHRSANTTLVFESGAQKSPRFRLGAGGFDEVYGVSATS